MIDTKDEVILLEKTVELWNLWTSLPQTHPSDIEELRTYIHQIQGLISLRMSRKAFPESFPTHKPVAPVKAPRKPYRELTLEIDPKTQDLCFKIKDSKRLTTELGRFHYKTGVITYDDKCRAFKKWKENRFEISDEAINWKGGLYKIERYGNNNYLFRIDLDPSFYTCRIFDFNHNILYKDSSDPNLYFNYRVKSVPKSMPASLSEFW